MKFSGPFPLQAGEVISPSHFEPFPKLSRLSRECVITEKLDGTNAQISILPSDGLNHHEVLITARDEAGNDFHIRAGSRNRWLTPGNDNYGFARWVMEHSNEIIRLGQGRHFGEWWGNGIQRGYGQPAKHFSLFNVGRWIDSLRATPLDQISEKQCECPPCCRVVPVLYRGEFDTAKINATLTLLGARGSVAAPGFGDPEGIVIFHTASGTLFKKTLKDDEVPKSQQKIIPYVYRREITT